MTNNKFEVHTVPNVITKIICLVIKVWVWFGVKFRVIVNSFRDCFSVLLRAQHYSMLKTFSTGSRP